MEETGSLAQHLIRVGHFATARELYSRLVGKGMNAARHLVPHENCRLQPFVFGGTPSSHH